MRWLAQLTPTVDSDRAYVVTPNGDCVCLAVDTGTERWRKNYQTDLDGRRRSWGFCDYPLVDGDRLIICPGGDTNTVTALDKRTGAVVWACPVAGEASAHSVLVAAEVGGEKQYIVHLWKGLYGISAAGKLLWNYPGLANAIANTHAPIVRGAEVFYANGYGSGFGLIKLAKAGDVWSPELVYRQRGMTVAWLGSPTEADGHVYLNFGGGLSCLDWKTGREEWLDRRVGWCTYTIADGKLFVRRLDSGQMLLAPCDPHVWKQAGEFTPARAEAATSPPAGGALPAWTFPVVANGRLYVRDFGTLRCFDVRQQRGAKAKVPDAVFVPTPDDVVTRMLELAEVRKDDVVYDLGSGDGRIVIAAAKSRGCRAVGVELDAELVRQSRMRAKDAGVDTKVRFDHGDLFDADLSEASVVALYILPEMTRRLIPNLNRLKPGSRVVSHCFAIPGVKPAKVVRVRSADDDVERPVYLYTVPLTVEVPEQRDQAKEREQDHD